MNQIDINSIQEIIDNMKKDLGDKKPIQVFDEEEYFLWCRMHRLIKENLKIKK